MKSTIPIPTTKKNPLKSGKLRTVDSQEIVCTPGAVLSLQTVCSGKKLCDEIDHDQIDLSPIVTAGLSSDTNPGNTRYTTNFVLDLPFIATPSMLP